MSKDKPATDAPPKKGGAKKMVVYGIGGLALVGAGVGGGVYAAASMSGSAVHEDPRRPKLVERSTSPAAVATDKADDKAPPRRTGTISVKSDATPLDKQHYEVAYYPIDQTFTSNLADGTSFAQVGLSVATYFDSRVADNLQRHMVPIRSAVLMVMSDQQAQVLATPEGKQMLQRRLTKAINGVLRDKEGFGGIDNVYFTTLVVQ